MKNMDSSHFQAMARQDKSRQITIVAILMISSAAILIIGINMQDAALAKTILIPVLFIISACAGFLVLRLTAKMERDSFQEGMYLIMEGVPMNCTLINEKGAALHCNDYAMRLFDVTNRAEYCAKLFTEFLAEFQPDGTRSLEKAGEHIKAAYQRGVESFRWWHQKGSEGEQIPCEITLVAASVYGMNRVLVFLRDLREEEKIRKQEEAMQERMQAILDASPLLCCIYDDRGNALEVNKEAERLFGVPDKKIFISHFNDFLPSRQPDGIDSIQKNLDCFRRVLKEGYCAYEWVYQYKDGPSIPTEEILNCITIDGKNLVIAFSRDLREFYANKEKDNLVQQNIQTMMEQLNGNVSEQAAAVTESAAAIEEMVANIQSVTNALTKNTEHVQELLSASEIGNQGINNVVADIRGIAQESESLMEINSVMANIASQTNLL